MNLVYSIHQAMLTKKAQNTKLNAIYERLVYDKSGALLRVRFTISDAKRNGVLQPNIISIEPVVSDVSVSAHAQAASSAPILLSNPKPASAVVPTPRLTFFESIISPYISLDFLMSQPTRAPSCN